MSITSYAQNFEDVMLWRALGHIEGGSYIDVGAQDPVVDSVSLAFHEHGWHGIHVEPTPHYAELLRQQRPGDTVIQAAVGNGSAILHFFEIPGTGISTADATIAAQHKERGFDVHEITVTSVTLSAVFDLCTAAEIHWLKIDVEGFEKKVLDSWGAHSARPWIVVIESTLPLTQIESHEEWEAVIIGYGYSPVYFDGLNRYYVSDAHPELTAAFASPPNVFDGFSLNGTASATFHKLIEARYQDKVSETLAQGEQQKQALQQETDRLKTDISSLTEAQQALSEQASQAKLEVQTLLSTHAEKEREVAVQLLTVQERAAQTTAELTSSQAERERAFQAAHSVQAEALHQKIETLQDKVAAIYVNVSLREQTFLEQFRLVKGESDALLRDHTEHERDVHAQLLAAQHQASLEKTELMQAHAHTLRELQIQQAQREQTITQQLHANEEEVRALYKDRLEREHQTGQEIADLVRLHHEEERALLRYQAEQEKTNDRQLLAQQQEFHQLQLEQLKREQALLEAHGRAQKVAEDLLNAVIQREQELHAQLLTTRQQAEVEKGELQQEYSVQEQALHRQYAEHQAALTQQLQGLRQELHRQQENKAQIEKELRLQIQTLQNEKHSLQEAQQLQAQEHELDLSAKLAEHNRVREASQALEEKLQREIQAEQQASQHLQDLLTDVKRRLANTYKSFSWRMTAPLRRITTMFALNENQTLAPATFNKARTPELAIPFSIEAPSITGTGTSLTPLTQPFAQATPPDMSIIAPTLPELLAHYDREFVECTYQTLLGRAPDTEGLAYYLGRLRAGYSKIGILEQLRSSNEGRTYAATLPGLDTAIQLNQKGRYPLIGGLVRRIYGIDGNNPTECKLRAIENQLGCLTVESNRRFTKITTALTELHQLTVQQTQSVAEALRRASSVVQIDPDIPPIPPLEPDEFKQLSPRARDIYFQLKTAAVIRAVRAE